MIFAGFEDIPKTRSQGSFFCPQCLVSCDYKEQISKLFFTINFVPIFPFSTEGSFVECQVCRATYEPEILNAEKEGTEFTPHVKRMVSEILKIVSVVDGRLDDREVVEIELLSSELLLEQPDKTLKMRIAERISTPAVLPVLNMLRRSRGCLNTVGKEKILIAAIRVAMADETLHDQEIAVIFRIGKALGINRLEVQRI